jgi:hypothetical protein
MQDLQAEAVVTEDGFYPAAGEAARAAEIPVIVLKKSSGLVEGILAGLCRDIGSHSDRPAEG